jgi:hypothetical protein
MTFTLFNMFRSPWQTLTCPGASSLGRLLRTQGFENGGGTAWNEQCVPMHSKFQNPIWLQDFFFCLFFILLLLPLVITFFASPLSFSLLHDDKRTNERTNERTNGKPPFLSSCSSFAYHYWLFAFCIVPPSFDTRSATTTTTTIGTTTMLMTAPPLLHVAQKGPF